MLESKEIGLQFKQSIFKPFFYVGMTSLFRIEGNDTKEKDRLNRNAIWCDMFLFNNFKIIVVILFSPSVLPVGVIKNDSIFKGGR